jgi:hypothetical protein
MRRPLSAHRPVHGSVLQQVPRAIARLPHTVRRAIPVAILCFGILALGVARLTEVHGAMRTPARPGSSGGSTPTITSFDAPGAGTGALQGTFGTSINASGDIAGIYLTSPNVAHGFVRSGSTGTITVFNAPNAGSALNQGTFPTSIDIAGDVTGMYFDANNAYHGFVRSGATGAMTEFDVTGAPTNVGHRGTTPISINDSGSITGIYIDTNAVRHGFVRTVSNGTATFATFNVTNAGSPLGTAALSINAAGEITGSYVDTSGVFHGFVRSAAGTITASIDAPGAGTVAAKGGFSFTGTLPLSIDAAGDIAGIYTDSNGVHHGFFYTASANTPTFTTFDVTGAGTAGLFPGTMPASINFAGDIGGFYEDSSGVNHAFFRSASTGTITAPLDAAGASTSGMFPGTMLISINAVGDGTGTYTDTNGVFHGFVLAPPSAATPTFSPAPGAYSSAQTVTISDATTGASIYYTTDGTTPTTASALYSGPISVDSTETIEAIATAVGFSNSAAGSAIYTISTNPPAGTPTFSPAAGTYTSAQTVSISDATTGATIYYTTNGTTPTTASTAYTGPISVSSTETIEAIAAAPAFSNSAVATAAYTINAPAPDFTVSVSPTTLTIVAGQSGQATFTVTPQNGFNSKVSFACSGLPSEASCSFSPTSVTPNGAPLTTTLTVSTTAASAAMRFPVPPSQRPIYAVLFPLLAMLFGLSARRRRAIGSLRLLGLLVLLTVGLGLTSCSGGNTAPVGNPGTPVGTSSASVSASVVGAAAHSAILTITITH